MCVYSVFVQETQKQWTGLAPNSPSPWVNPAPYQQGTPFNPHAAPWYDDKSLKETVPSVDLLREIRELGKRIDALDKKVGAIDCKEDADGKRAFEDRLDRLIADAEALRESIRCDGE
jgi:hypothetical protein